MLLLISLFSILIIEHLLIYVPADAYFREANEIPRKTKQFLQFLNLICKFLSNWDDDAFQSDRVANCCPAN